MLQAMHVHLKEPRPLVRWRPASGRADLNNCETKSTAESSICGASVLERLEQIEDICILGLLHQLVQLVLLDLPQHILRLGKPLARSTLGQRDACWLLAATQRGRVSAYIGSPRAISLDDGCDGTGHLHGAGGAPS